MTTFNIIYFISILVTIAVMGFIAWYSRRHRDVAGSETYMWISLLVCLMAFLDGMVMISPTRNWALVWFNLRFISFSTIPVLWLMFVLQYTGKTKLLTRFRVAVLFIIPLITQIMIWTNSLHSLWVIHDISFREVGPFFIADTSARIIGPWNKVHLLYTYTVMLAGVVLLFMMSARLFRQYRGQAIALGVGTLIMIAGSLFPTFNLLPGSNFNPLPQSFAAGSLIIAWGMYRYRFLGTKPLFDEEKRIPTMLFALFLLLTGGITFTGYFYYQQYEKQFRVEVERQLSSIAELKVSELVQWRKERLGDAAILYENIVFTSLARRVINNPADAEAHRLMRAWLGKIQSTLKYDNIRLLDIKGKPRISVPGTTEPVCRYLLQRAGEINRTGKITFLDFHRDAPDKPIHLSVVIPIIDESEKRSIGLVVLYIDPKEYLYPLLSRWPTPSKTAETLLLRREGNDALFLNELKFKKDTALSLRISLTDLGRTAAMAASGREGIVEGIDYRGVRVIADVRAVPDSSWIMVARMDTAEVYAPIRERIWLIILVVCVLLFGTGSGAVLLWQNQSHRFYLQQYESANALKVSETFLSSVIEHSPHAMWISDERGTLIRINQACRDLLNITDDEVVGKYNVLKDSIIEKQGFLPLIRKVFEKGEIARFTLRYNSAELKGLLLEKTVSLILEVTISPVMDAGNVTNAIIQHVDITKRIQAEKTLRESERQYRNLFENSLEGIYQTTPEGKLISVNMAFARMFGYESPEEIVGAIGNIAGQLYANPEERKKAVNVLQKTGYLKDFECQMRRKDGTAFWTLINARFTENQDGLRYFEGFIIDITERKRAEEEIFRLNTELEIKVAVRTSELRESQLALLNLVDDLNRSAKNIALTNQTLEATNKELEAFSYSVSHDLRAPLRSIDGFSLALLEDYQKKLDDTGRNYLKKVRSATQHMGNLIDDMLKLSRVTQSEFHKETINLSKMVYDIVQTHKKSTSDRTVKTVIHEEIIVQGDPNLLQLALINLIDNAWKFTSKQKHPHIEFGATLKEGKTVIFVRDNGVGFDMSYAGKLFGAFQRLHTKDEFAGTGIGLATVRRIITRHGGQIWAEGEVGKGAVFYFILP